MGNEFSKGVLNTGDGGPAPGEVPSEEVVGLETIDDNRGGSAEPAAGPSGVTEEGSTETGASPAEGLTPEDLELVLARRVSDARRPALLWYVLHTLTGHEEKVKRSVLRSVEDRGLQEYFEEILVPTEEVTKTTKKGKTTSRKVFFPGYILVRMVINEKTWALVLGAPGVTGFVKAGSQAVPLTPDEVRTVLDQVEGRKSRMEYVVDFEPGETVKIAGGPFANFTAVVEDIYPEREKIKVLVTVFGRGTVVELGLAEVEKGR